MRWEPALRMVRLTNLISEMPNATCHGSFPKSHLSFPFEVTNLKSKLALRMACLTNLISEMPNPTCHGSFPKSDLSSTFEVTNLKPKPGLHMARLTNLIQKCRMRPDMCDFRSHICHSRLLTLDVTAQAHPTHAIRPLMPPALRIRTPSVGCWNFERTARDGQSTGFFSGRQQLC